MFSSPPEAKAIKKAGEKLEKAEAFLSNDSVRDRVHRLRRQEIEASANDLSSDARRLSAASAALNAAILSTPAGEALETELTSIMERHPTLSRNDIISACKNDTLAGKIGEDTLKPHVGAVFEQESVQNAWDTLSSVGDTIEKRSATLASRLKAYEEQFPGEVDTEKLKETVDEAMNGLQKLAEEPIAEDPKAKDGLYARLAELARKIAEFFEKLFGKAGFGPKP
jgi:hypothetical protein